MLIKIDFDSETPIYLQLRNQIVIGIGSGKLVPEESLPTVRQMATDLGINTMTVNKAYGLLKNEGFLSIDRRKGAKVSVSALPPANYEALKEKLNDELALVISEAGLRGIKKKDFLKLCGEIFDSMKGLSRDNETTPNVNRNEVGRNGVEIWF